MLRAASTAFVALAAAAALPADPAADERQEQVLQGVMRFPELARIDVVDPLPDLRLAHAAHPVDGEVAVVELLHLPGQPARMWTPLVMWPMGISSSTRHGQRWAHIRRLTWPCRLLTALARRESFSPSTVMQNVSCSFCGSTRPRPINCSKEIPSSSRSGPRCSSIRLRSKRSWPAGTGVWVVKTVCWATSRRADRRSSGRRPSSARGWPPAWRRRCALR